MHADKLALAVAPSMRVLTLLLMPFVVTIDWVVQIALRLAGLNQQDGDSAQLALAELRGAIELHGTETDEENTTSTDDKTREERAMLRSVLDLRDVEVSEIMIHRRNIFMLDANMPTQELVQSLLESTYTRIPIYRDTPENVIGILHAKEVLRAIHTHNGDLDAMNLLEHTSAPMFIPETTPLLQQLNAFRSDGRHFAIVVDEYGTMMGIVTLEDILEEIVGDISDETDVHISGIIEETPDYIVVEGQVTIRDLNRRYEWRLSDEDANTIAGLVLYASQRIPEKGQSYLVDGYKITVEKREKNRLTVLRVAPPEDRPIIA
jgi:Mg2+/Co2+ transporter CorB